MLISFVLLCLLVLAVTAFLARRLAPLGDSVAATAGALAFVGFPLVLLALLQAIGLDLPAKLPVEVQSAHAAADLLVVALGAVSQETTRLFSVWVVLRFRHRLPSATWHGVGFGGAELLYLAFGAAGAAIAPMLLGATVPAAMSIGVVDVLIGIAERCAAVAAHIVYSYAACAAIANRSPTWFIAAASVHAAANLAAAVLPREHAVAASFVGVLALGSFAALVLIHRRATWLR
ncbi:MAG: hypothetical protein OHK0044_32410 [Burkholderiaceae bacterium]